MQEATREEGGLAYVVVLYLCYVVFLLGINIIIISYSIIVTVLWIDLFKYGIFVLCIKCMV